MRRLPPGSCLLASLLTVAASTAGIAAAGDGSVRPDPATAASPALADHVRRGDRARLLGRWADAASAYGDALAAAERAELPEEKRAAILGELGAAEVALERYRDGAEHLHKSLVHEKALTGEQKQRFRKAREEAIREIAILVVAVNPSDAELMLDNQPIPVRRSSHILFVEPGQHTLRARLPGFVASSVRHNAPKGTQASLALQLAQVPPAPKAAPREARAVVVREPPVDLGARFRVPVLITAGGAALLGGGLLGAAIAVDDAVEDRTADLGARAGLGACHAWAYEAPCERLGTLVDTRDALARVGWGAMFVGAGLGAVGLGSLLLGPGEKERVRMAVVPGGVVVRGEL